jgi:hypothetical protein
LRPWSLNVENSGLCVALPSLPDLSTTQPSLFPCSAASLSESNAIACILSQKKLDHNLILSSVRVSLLRSATKSHSRNEGSGFNLSPACQMRPVNCSSSSPYLAFDKQRQLLHADAKLTHVSMLGKIGQVVFFAFVIKNH